MDQEVGALQLAEDIPGEPDEIDAIRDAEPLRLLAKRAPVVGLAESRRSDQAGPQRTLRKGRREGFDEDMLALPGCGRATIAMVFTSSRTSTARSGYGIAFGSAATIIPA